ncbi:hypothetical protein AgCh_038830 [Apium graveolens]
MILPRVIQSLLRPSAIMPNNHLPYIKSIFKSSNWTHYSIYSTACQKRRYNYMLQMNYITEDGSTTESSGSRMFHSSRN